MRVDVSVERMAVGDGRPPPTVLTQCRRPQLRTTTHSRAGAGALPSTCSTASTRGQSTMAAAAIKSQRSNLLARTRISPPRGRIPSASEAGILKPEVEGAPSRCRLSPMTNFLSHQRELVHVRRLRAGIPWPPRPFGSRCHRHRATLAPAVHNARHSGRNTTGSCKCSAHAKWLGRITRQYSPGALPEISPSGLSSASSQPVQDRIRPQQTASSTSGSRVRSTTNPLAPINVILQGVAARASCKNSKLHQQAWGPLPRPFSLRIAPTPAQRGPFAGARPQ